MADSIRVRVNGEERDLPSGTTVGGLLGLLGVDRAQVAVERNRDVVPRRRFDDTLLDADDRIEIVTFVGGG